MDSEICIMRTSGCKREENCQKVILLAYNCEGKKEMVIKKTRQMLTNSGVKCKFGTDMIQCY